MIQQSTTQGDVLTLKLKLHEVNSEAEGGLIFLPNLQCTVFVLFRGAVTRDETKKKTQIFLFGSSLVLNYLLRNKRGNNYKGGNIAFSSIASLKIVRSEQISGSIAA